MIKVPFIEEELTKGIGIISKSKEGGRGMPDVESPNPWSRGNPDRFTKFSRTLQRLGRSEPRGRLVQMIDTLCKLMSKARGMNGCSEMRLQKALIGS